MKKLLITGALGHIGSRFIHALQPGDYAEVVLLDNLATQRYCSLFNLPAGVPFRFVEADVCTANLEPLLTEMDVVLHLAAITNAAGSFEIQDQVERVNFEGTERVARACVATGSKLIFLSTTSVYGTQDEIVDENCPAADLKPQSPYAASKLRAEQMLQSLGRDTGLQFVVCRFGTIYGTSIGMRFHTAINKFCWQACLGQPITVWRTALHQKRPYLNLDDAIQALKFIIATSHFDNEIYNVLTDNATVGEIIEIIRSYLPPTQIEYVDSRIMNQLSYTVASDKFRKLGFRFDGNLTRGIGDTIRLLQGISQQQSQVSFVEIVR
jgi:nucleoside-diphosphate-sugar epimerase